MKKTILTALCGFAAWFLGIAAAAAQSNAIESFNVSQ